VPLTGASLDHDRDVDRIRQAAEEFLDRTLAGADRRAVIGRHHHHHRRAGLLCRPAALDADPRAENASW